MCLQHLPKVEVFPLSNVISPPRWHPRFELLHPRHSNTREEAVKAGPGGGGLLSCCLLLFLNPFRWSRIVGQRAGSERTH